MARTDSLGHFLTDVADAIREKKGTIETITARDFDTEIENLPSGADLSEYFGTELGNGNINEGGWLNLVKKIPPVIISGNKGYYAFNRYKGTELPQITFDNVTNYQYMFTNCINITSIPNLPTGITNLFGLCSGCSSLVTSPNIDVSNCSNIGNMFSSCTNLENVIIYNTSKVQNFNGTFNSCFKLTDTSLDNILQMCINATSYTGTKTLKYLGIFNTTYYPVSRIEALPHYQDFINAGWTIGY